MSRWMYAILVGFTLNKKRNRIRISDLGLDEQFNEYLQRLWQLNS